MNTDRSVKELLDLFEIKDISQLGSDVIRIFFDDISYKEVMKLCRVNKQFNIACNKESMWKRKVENDYGISKMYESTWKETARLLFEINMINLNANWVNGKTYKELFQEALKLNDNYFFDLYSDQNLLPMVFPDYVNNIETAKAYAINPKETIISWVNVYNENMTDNEKEETYDYFNRDYDNILDDEDMIKNQVLGMTREFSILAHASAEIEGRYADDQFGLAQLAFKDTGDEDLVIIADANQKKMNERLIKLVDPMLYVMSYCLMSRKNLSLIHIW